MPKFVATVRARADIRERWLIEAENRAEARERAENDLSNQEFLSEGVVGNEEDREVVGIETYVEPALHQVSILWGQDLEPGDKAKTYTFSTAIEKSAFMLGVEEAVGWLSHREVEPGYVYTGEGD